MTSSALARFHVAQDRAGDGFAEALTELETTGKRGHWIWYVLPQIEGLGGSAASRQYAIADAGEAAAYLRDPVLRARLLRIAGVVADKLEAGRPLESLMGSRIDALKTVSSLTLFERAAKDQSASEAECAALAEIAARALVKAEAQGYPRCRHTLGRLREPGASST